MDAVDLSVKVELPAVTRRRGILAVIFLLVILQTEGCYYMQAVRGHADLMNRRRPMDEVIADSASPEELRQKLVLVNAARDFAVTELKLPDNDSYRSYADLERDYVVWNVFAAPEFSLQPKTWCFPVAGCVAYRGYFS
ncbi:MAG: aminopeptidase, partial [Woeseiaceae bacterium]